MKTAFNFNERKILCLLLVCIMAVSVFATACGGGDISDASSPDQGSGETAVYTVKVSSTSGLALSEVDVFIYADAELTDMKDFSKTNENGEVSFTLPKRSDYSIVLSGAPKGYNVNASYSFIGERADIVLTSSLVTDGELSTAVLGIGDVMYDFTVMASDGTEITLSEVLKTKKAVLLNFWYTTCSWCLEEFPIMEEAYQLYKDDIEIIALDPFDDSAAVANFKQQQELSFIMASCPSSWANSFQITGYPTSVIIDRDGMICVIESGAITSLRPFVSAFDHFTAEEYKQKICFGGIGDLMTQIKPTYTMDTSEAVGALINSGDIEVTYRPETEDEGAEYIWPFIESEKFGDKAVAASNIGIDSSYAIMYADVTLKAGQAVGFDYYVSSERYSDILYVIVEDDDIYQISGTNENGTWSSCYPCVAEKDGTYEIAFCFYKDGDTAEGDDTVYITNMRVVDAEDIDVATYLPRYAATTEDGFDYSYVEIVFNEKDGYYHVGGENGPLLLADMMNYTQFNEELTVYDIVVNGDADKGGVSLYNEDGLGMVGYFNFASNSSINGLCTVNAELAEMLKQVAEVAGFDGTENEWLKICKYYQVYGKGVGQLEDPIKGLDPSSAFTATLGKNVATNYFYYDRAIIPRGLFAEFIPTKSGVYRFTSKSDYSEGIDAWIFDENREILYTYEFSERMYTDDINCSMVYYMEAGTPYYINMAYWDVYQTGYIYYDVEYLGSSIELFRSASPGYFTYDSNATGDVMYDIIAGGITPVLKDGKYYESVDGSLIYADFTRYTAIFDKTIEQMIDMGGFDFSKSETDGEIIAYLNQNDNDVDATVEYLKKLWGEDYDANAEFYQIEDIFAGRYHGHGEDCTEEMRAYLSKIDKSGNEERNGCVVVDERLGEILQLLMDKHTFEGVDHSWTKVCYYYDYLGPEK